MLRHFISGLFLLAAAVVTAPAAQCLGPDGLNGPCWAPTPANLPHFDGFLTEATNVCWTQCQPQQQCSVVEVGTPLSTRCGQYIAPLRVLDCAGVVLLEGDLVMDYTRTWDELKPVVPPQRLQVYRFAVKVDIRVADPGLVDPCAIPPCLYTHPTGFYYGYVDYAFDCTGVNQYENALVLFHNCDEFIHDQAISSTPGTFHPNRSYAIVAPSTPLNPFVATIITPPVGPLIAEATRNVPPAAGALCVTEDLLTSGNMQFLGNGCGCQFSLNPKQLTARRLTGVGSCVPVGGGPTSFTTLNLWPSFPWFHMMTTSMGSWTTTLAYPGIECAWVDEGGFLFNDSCSLAGGGPASFGEIYYGGSTSDGYLVLPNPLHPLSQRFTDLAANASFALPGAPAGPLIGTVLPTRNLIYVNVP